LDGGYVITGQTTSFGAGSSDAYLIKTNSLGDTLWTKTLGGSNADVGYCIQQTSDAGFIIAGMTYSIGTGSENIWLIKTDSSGNAIWNKTYGEGTGNYVIPTSDGGYIVSGTVLGPFRPILIKTDSMGDTLWTKIYDVGIGWGSGECVQETTSGGYVLLASYSNAYLIKTDASGDTLWVKKYGGSDWDWGQSFQQTSDGGYIIVGETESFGAGGRDVWIIKADSSGDTLWMKSLGGSDYDLGFSIQQTTDGGYIICGRTKSFGAGNNDVWLIKIAPDPNDVENENQLSILNNYILKQNYPNPFNPTTSIKYQIPELSFVTLKVYDVLGSKVATLVNKGQPQGNYEIEFDATTLPSGIYFYRIQAGSFVETKKMVLLR